jgi:hypothetical protein
LEFHVEGKEYLIHSRLLSGLIGYLPLNVRIRATSGQSHFRQKGVL